MSTELKTNTAVKITVGPFLDKTDGITPELALIATNEHITFVVDTAGVPTLVIDADATASGGDNDLVHITNDNAGYYSLELTDAQLNYLGNAKLSINYETDHLPVFHEISIVSAQYWDAKYGAGNFSADVKAVGGASQSMTDLKDFADTGYDPATHKVAGVVLTDLATAATSVTNIVTANVTQLGGVAQSLTDLKDFADTGYDPVTHKIQGVVLTDLATATTSVTNAVTITSNADMTSILADTNELQGLISSSKLPAQVKGTDDIDFSATQKTSLNASTPASIQGSVKSVTDNVNAQVKGIDTDIITAASLKADAITKIVAGMKARLVDGTITGEKFDKIMLAVSAGNYTWVNSVATFKDQAGATLFTMTIADASGTGSIT